jgi:hypothetical protein
MCEETTQDGKAANQYELPLGTKYSLALVAGVCGKIHDL